MTRINCVPPDQLCQQHLVAEYRELPRIFGAVEKAILRGERPNDSRNPTAYKLGTGHVRFFYPRLGYLVNRQTALIAEMQRRGITTNFKPPKRSDFPLIADGWFQQWEPDAFAIKCNMDRINDRMPVNPIFKNMK